MTLNNILKHSLNEGRDFSFAWRIFLDQFYIADKKQRASLIESAPSCLEDSRHLAYCAAGIHMLCRTLGQPMPTWVTNTSFILEEPYFPGATTDLLRLVCLIESPPEFKMRNIFTTENVLGRA
ncbi:MAG: hypothetical protein K0R57_6229 [Paenibacillaceae bacterium]|jgi:hypothetical protein|nr:hypothetical protein [Paenibacillaceae bacterium]